MTTTATSINLHQPVIDRTAVRCAAPDCGHVIYGLLHPERMEVPRDQEHARNLFTRMHTAEHAPGKAPSIEVDYIISAYCSVCPDGGDVDQIESDTLECSKCKTTWDERGNHGERAEQEDPS